jgi:aerobic-type carbon monoxide dehydrogenase small subunit (CoxS/CutS family)
VGQRANPNGTSYTSPICIVCAASFDRRAIRTVEGRAKNGELPVLQKAFIDRLRSSAASALQAS